MGAARWAQSHKIKIDEPNKPKIKKG